ncbi:glycosyltransferase [Candidatus Bathyarchaeota archaeon]|nr:glycosyltransferase [Candidatus Bathyarchaeota archaeon]
MYPKVTFVIPTYNASKLLPRCLKSIAVQDYPRDRVEVLVVDGGSNDKTVDIAKAFGARVVPNPKRLAEYGVQSGVLEADGDLVVVFAADNELHSREWLKKVSVPFIENPGIAAVWGRLISGTDDSPVNKYFELIQNDPFSNFFNKNLEHYLAHSKMVGGQDANYYVFKVAVDKPLIWGANGLTYRKNSVRQFWDRHTYLGDNDAFQSMIESGDNIVAYMPSLLIYHHHVNSIQNWVTKWKRNFSKHFLEKRKDRNLNWVFTEHFKLKLVMWLIYSLIPVLAFADSVKNAIRDRNRHWMYHSIACFTQTLIYIYICLFTLKGRQMISEQLFYFGGNGGSK